MNILLLSSLPWNFLWQRPHHIASLLAKKGNKVVYYDVPTYISAGEYLEKIRKNQAVEIVHSGNVSVVRLYFPDSRGTFASLKNVLFERAFKSSLKKLNFQPDISIFYSLNFVPLIKTLNPSTPK